MDELYDFFAGRGPKGGGGNRRTSTLAGRKSLAGGALGDPDGRRSSALGSDNEPSAAERESTKTPYHTLHCQCNHPNSSASWTPWSTPETPEVYKHPKHSALWNGDPSAATKAGGNSVERACTELLQGYSRFIL